MKKYIEYKDNEYLVAFELKDEYIDGYVIFNEDSRNKWKISEKLKEEFAQFSTRDNKLFYKEVELKLYFPLETIKEAYLYYIKKDQVSSERIEYDEKGKFKRKRLITSPL